MDSPIINFTTDIQSKAEQHNEVPIETYKALHQSSDLEVRSRCSLTLPPQLEDLESMRHHSRHSRAAHEG